MTGKEAIRAVATMSLAEASFYARGSNDPTLSLVAGWRVTNGAEFADLAEAVGLGTIVEYIPGRPCHSRKDASAMLIAHFETWSTVTSAAEALGTTRASICKVLKRMRGYHVERRHGTFGLEWRLVREDSQ